MSLEAVVAEVDGGVLVAVYTQPRASKTRIVGLHDNMLKIACCSPPVDGKANKELVGFLANVFGCAKSTVTLLRGQISRRKQFLLSAVPLGEVKLTLDQ